jgi:hypothetical protein
MSRHAVVIAYIFVLFLVWILMLRLSSGFCSRHEVEQAKTTVVVAIAIESTGSWCMLLVVT